MPRFLSLSSGSNGNCYYIGNMDSGILIDAGIGIRTLKQRLENSGLGLDAIRMLLVTHDHTDHIRGIGSIAKRLSVPIYTTSVLHSAIARKNGIGEEISGCRRVLRTGQEIVIGEYGITAFEVPHDATQTLGYRIRTDGHSIVIMTDLGRVPEYALEYCREADYVVIESNYDMDMLIHGSYPPELKARVISERGHLSNDMCADAIRRFLHPRLKGVFLCHLSQDNNSPDIAHRESWKVISRAGGSQFLKCLPRSEVFSMDL